MGTILLIEDNPADARLVCKALEAHQVECDLTIFSDGESAIQYIEALDAGAGERPGLVIVDLSLPKRSGREVLQTIRASRKCAQVHVFVLSSSDAEQDRDETARLGASDYIRKPTRLQEFLNLGATFRNALNLRA